MALARPSVVLEVHRVAGVPGPGPGATRVDEARGGETPRVDVPRAAVCAKNARRGGHAAGLAGSPRTPVSPSTRPSLDAHVQTY